MGFLILVRNAVPALPAWCMQIEPDRELQVGALALARREAAMSLSADHRLLTLAAQVLP